MAAQKGSSLLIKLSDGGSPDSFTTLAGLRTKSITLNSETVDVTNSDSVNKWRELLAGAGIKSASFSGTGVLQDNAQAHTDIVTLHMGGTIRTWQVIVPGLGTYQGAFQIASIEQSGEHNAEVVFTVTLESAGELQFTAS